MFSGGWNCKNPLPKELVVTDWRLETGRDITLNLCYMSYAFMVDGCVWLCVVYLSYILCCIFDIPELMF